MIKKVVAIVFLILGSLLTLLGVISVYSFITGEIIWFWFPVDTILREDWATVRQVGLLVPSIWNLVFTFGSVTMLFGIAYFLLRGKENRNLTDP